LQTECDTKFVGTFRLQKKGFQRDEIPLVRGLGAESPQGLIFKNLNFWQFEGKRKHHEYFAYQ
jgi:hypothetical protein